MTSLSWTGSDRSPTNPVVSPCRSVPEDRIVTATAVRRSGATTEPVTTLHSGAEPVELLMDAA